ncbi:hypothetical protein Tco_0397084 [Tanacetum coccineum]
MSTPTFAETYNLVAFLEKPTEGEGFEQIVDFLNANLIKYALTVNPTIHTSCIEQFWTSAKVKTIKEEVRIQALVDGKKVIVNEASIRRDLRLDDAEVLRLLPGMNSVALWTQRKEIEVPYYKSPNEESVPTPSNDPLPSGEDRMQLTELMVLCTKLKKQVLDLEEAKTAQAKEIVSLKKRVKNLERKQRSRTSGLKRLKKVGAASRVESFEDEEIELVDETQGRMDDQDMFDVNVDLQGDEVVADEEVVSAAANVEVTTISTPTTTIDEMALARTLIEINAAKPKAITTAATTVTTAITRPKAKGVVIQEPSKATTPIIKPLISSKEKGKGIMVEDPLLMKKKDQIKFDEEVAKELKAKLKAEKEEEDKAARLKEEEANIALIDVKRTGAELEQEKSKKQKTDEHKEVEVDDEVELKKYMEIFRNDDVVIDAIPLATKPPVIVEYKIVKEGIFRHFQLIRADGSSKRHSSMIKMLQGIDREDLQTLWKLVKANHGDKRPEDENERVLWGDLKVMFEPDRMSEVWRSLQGYRVTIWKLIDSCGVHYVSVAELLLPSTKLNAVSQRVTTIDKSYNCWMDKD